MSNCSDWDDGPDDDWYYRRDDDEPVDCPHEQADIDVLSGRAWCPMCGEAWWASEAEIKAQIQWYADYAESVAQEMSAVLGQEGKG